MDEMEDILIDRVLLTNACKKGCTESIARLYSKYRQEICDYLHKAGANGLVEDICQTVFMCIQEGKCDYDGSSDVISYLKGVSRNIYKQHVSSLKIKTCIDNAGDVICDFSHFVKDNPEKILADAEAAKELKKRISQLPSKTREAIKLVYIDGISARQAAKIANCEFKLFCNRLDYGLRCLKTYLYKK